MAGRSLGPAWAGGSGQSPDRASETLDFSPGSRPHIKANLRGARPRDKWKIKEGEVSTGHRERQPAGDHSEEALTQPWWQPSWGAKARREPRPGQVEPGRGTLARAWPPHYYTLACPSNACLLLNPFPARQQPRYTEEPLGLSSREFVWSSSSVIGVCSLQRASL